MIIEGGTRDVQDGPEMIGYAVACGNVVCNPGDALVGESDAIVVVPQHLITVALEKTLAQEPAEATMRSKIPLVIHQWECRDAAGDMREDDGRAARGCGTGRRDRLST